MSFSERLGHFTGQPEGSLLRLDADSLRKIAYELSYEDLCNLCRTCSRYRRVMESPDFWWEKTKRDFPKVSEEEFRHLLCVDGRHRYLHYYLRQLYRHRTHLQDTRRMMVPIKEDKIAEIRSIIHNILTYDELVMIEKLQCQIDLLQSEIDRAESEVEDVDKKIASIEHGLVRRYRDSTNRLPRLARWSTLESSTLPPTSLHREGDAVFCTYKLESGVEMIIDVTSVFDENVPLRSHHLILAKGRLTLEEFSHLMQYEGLEFLYDAEMDRPTKPKPGDILLDAACEMNIYFNVRADGTDEAIVTTTTHLPQEALEVFKSRNIHSRADLKLAYKDGDLDYETIGDPNHPLKIPRDESEYKEMKPGYYHASRV